MPSFIERLSSDLEETKLRMSERWRKHSNRRSTIAFALILGVGGFLYYNVIAPPETFPAGRLVTITEGMPLQTVAETLKQDGVVQSATALRIAVQALGTDKSVHAGDYLFKEPKNVLEVARALVVGAYGLEPIRIRVPEGATVAQMAKIFAPQLERFDKERFLQEATPLEGYLFPDTYFFLPNATENTVMKTMYDNFQTQITSIQPQIDASGHTLKEIVIMASLLEKEARISKDRRMIAGVLWNRVRKGMLLQVDAAFLYILGRTTFDLTLKDLQVDSPYNTYKYKGLPIGPIANPSLDSILAAANPIKNDYLFYLADNSGVTHYSKTYQQHLRLKNLYIP